MSIKILCCTYIHQISAYYTIYVYWIINLIIIVHYGINKVLPKLFSSLTLIFYYEKLKLFKSTIHICKCGIYNSYILINTYYIYYVLVTPITYITLWGINITFMCTLLYSIRRSQIITKLLLPLSRYRVVFICAFFRGIKQLSFLI